jgi:hypothetical protein
LVGRNHLCLDGVHRRREFCSALSLRESNLEQSWDSNIQKRKAKLLPGGRGREKEKKKNPKDLFLSARLLFLETSKKLVLYS